MCATACEDPDAASANSSPTSSTKSYSTAPDELSPTPDAPPRSHPLVEEYGPSRFPDDESLVEISGPFAIFTPVVGSSSASSIVSSALASRSEEDVALRTDYGGCDSPPPPTERTVEMRNERQYRLLLAHEFHPSRECCDIACAQAG